MGPTVHAATRIFEDPEPIRSPKHKRVPSVGDVLRGRRKETSPSEAPLNSRRINRSPSPLGERHINSPPQPKKVPLKGDEKCRPPMHKKTGSSTSFKGFLLGREKSSDSQGALKADYDVKQKEPRSAVNLAGLLKKRSRKNMKENMPESESVTTEQQASPIAAQVWPRRPAPYTEQFSGRQPILVEQKRTISQEIELYTPKDNISIDHMDYMQHTVSNSDFEPPQRPFLEHKSSRSSIFTENLDEESETAQFPTDGDRSRAPMHPDSSNFHHDTSSSQVPDRASPSRPELKVKRSSRILDTITSLHLKMYKDQSPTPTEVAKPPLSSQELDSAMENMLGKYDVPQNLRDQLRNLKPEVKAGLMRGDRVGSGGSDHLDREGVRSKAQDNDRPGSKDSAGKESKRSRSRSRTRSRIMSFSKRHEASPSKQETGGRARSKSRPRSIDLSRTFGSKNLVSTISLASTTSPDCAVMPGDFIHYLREVQKPELVEVGKLHKLRILLRNEAVTWTDAFVRKGGMDEIVQLLYRIMKIEWREEHEDSLLHETLLCLKGLSTTSLALQRLDALSTDLFPVLLRMLFDPERKGPAEFSTRGIIIALFFAHHSASLHGDSEVHLARTRQLLLYLHDTMPEDEKRPIEFVAQMRTSRPFRMWCKEVTNVTKEVFWIFLHHMNVIPILDAVHEGETEFVRAYFPALRAPHPAAPYVGGVEWEATQYLAAHLDLLNGLIVSLPSVEERNALRDELKQSGWEKVMGGTLRTCKEKFYGAVHDGLKAWVAAARQDGWFVEDVRAGPPRETLSPRKSPVKKGDEAPQLKLDMDIPALTKVDEDWL